MAILPYVVKMMLFLHLICNSTSAEPTMIPTSIPTFNPTTIPTNIPTAYPTSAEHWICDEKCDDDDSSQVYVETSFRFSDEIQYDMLNMECFVYQIIEEYMPPDFSHCDVSIIGVNGGHQLDENICNQGPCIESIDSTNTTTRRRLLQKEFDGTTTMTIYHEDTLNGSISTNAIRNDFIDEFAFRFDISMEASINTILIAEDDDTAWYLQTINIALFIGCLLFCCTCAIFLKYKHKCKRKLPSMSKPQRHCSTMSTIHLEYEGSPSATNDQQEPMKNAYAVINFNVSEETNDKFTLQAKSMQCMGSVESTSEDDYSTFTFPKLFDSSSEDEELLAENANLCI